MKKTQIVLAALSLVGLTACSTPGSLPPSKVAAPVAPFAPAVTQYADAQVNEAAAAYIALYKETIETSLQERRYMGQLAYRHLSAEACFDSRASRLLDKVVSSQEKEALVLSYVSPEQLKRYQAMAEGHFPRINGLELFTCDRAGLRVAQNTLKY